MKFLKDTISVTRLTLQKIIKMKKWQENTIDQTIKYKMKNIENGEKIFKLMRKENWSKLYKIFIRYLQLLPRHFERKDYLFELVFLSIDFSIFMFEKEVTMNEEQSKTISENFTTTYDHMRI